MTYKDYALLRVGDKLNDRTIVATTFYNESITHWYDSLYESKPIPFAKVKTEKQDDRICE